MDAQSKAPQTSTVAGQYMKNGESASVDGVQTQCKDTQNIGNAQVFVAPDNALSNGDWHTYSIKITDDIPTEKAVLLHNGRTIGSRDNVVVIIGKAKSKKTFCITSIGASTFRPTLGFTTVDDVKRLLVVDTEQGLSHVSKTLKRIYLQAGLSMDTNNDNIEMLALREVDTPDRITMIEAAIAEIKPDMLIIDGVRDLVRDFNDIVESSQIVGTLMRWSKQYNCLIVTVLHQNKNDNNARGHLGTELTNKSETVLSVVRDGETSRVSSAFSRNIEIDDFSFYINEQGIPESCKDASTTEKEAELTDMLRLAFAQNRLLEKSALRQRISALEAVSPRTADRRINTALKSNLIERDANGYFQIVRGSSDDDNLPF